MVNIFGYHFLQRSGVVMPLDVKKGRCYTYTRTQICCSQLSLFISTSKQILGPNLCKFHVQRGYCILDAFFSIRCLKMEV